MKVTLDISDLLNQNKITKAEYDKLLFLNKNQQKNHYAKILYIFGIVAICIGIINLAPTFFADLWRSLESTLGTSGILIALSVVSLAGAVKTKSGFLSVVSCLALISFLGYLVWQSSLKGDLDIVIAIWCSALALISFALANEGDGGYEGIALIYSRTALLITNIAFWIISWTSKGARADSFSVFWAIALIILGLWGAKQGRRFVVNICAVFGSIHFYTQYFKILGFNAISLIMGGVLVLVISSQLLRYNKNFRLN